jgi:hypothetical protein
MNSTIYAILGIAFLIFFHELGHWLVARGLGLKTVVFQLDLARNLHQSVSGNSGTQSFDWGFFHLAVL